MGAKKPTRESRRLRLWRAQGWKCPLCNVLMTHEEALDSERTNLDHITPKSHGGSDAAWNIQLTHLTCNHKKGCGCADHGTDYWANHEPSPEDVLGGKHLME
jgi:hypothetical protein